MKKLDIIYEDKFIIIVNKPPGLLTMSTNNEKEKTLFHQVIMYEKKKNKNNKIFIVHRLDKDTSGLVLFAKTERIKYILQNNWDQTVRKYCAIVEGKLKNKSGVVKSWLKETNNYISYSTNDKSAKLAITEYRLINHSKSYSLVDIDIKTGRKNQIRVHMNDLGNPIIGDKKYGAKTNPLRRLGLHAYYLKFNHPINNQVIELETKIPHDFINMFPQKKDA